MPFSRSNIAQALLKVLDLYIRGAKALCSIGVSEEKGS
jgi:hypothetical protein